MGKRIFVAGFLTETNTFSPFPTDLDSFRNTMWFNPGEAIENPSRNDTCYEYLVRAQALGWEVVGGLRTFAQPGGLVPQLVYEELRDNIIQHLEESLPVDAVLLSVHGAMVAELEPDGEGDLIERCRTIVGEDVPIGAHLDPHAHLSEKMVKNADVLRIWKQYPHTDIAMRCGEVFDLIKERLEGKPRAIPVLRDCSLTQVFHTTREPASSFVDRLSELEGHEGIQGVNFVHSFPWGDVPDMGAKILIYAESAASIPRAELLAEELVREVWRMKEACETPYASIDQALDRAFKQSAGTGPVVISDGPDNPGGGAPGDSTYFLHRLLERGDENWALGYLFDPDVVDICSRSGIGATLRLSIGGKICALSGEPVQVEAKVVGLVRDCGQEFGGQKMSSGTAVALDLGSNRTIVVNDKRIQPYDPVVFEELDVAWTQMQAVIVKSSQHFHALFAPKAGQVVYANPPGVLTWDLESLPYRNVDPEIWPLRKR